MGVSSPLPAARLAWRWLVLFFLVAAAAARADGAPAELSADAAAKGALKELVVRFAGHRTGPAPPQARRSIPSEG